MRSKLFTVFVLCLVLIKATAQEIDPDTVIYNGISGTYTLSERWKLFDQVVKQRKNIYQDEIKFTPTSAQFDQAKKDLLKLNDEYNVFEDSEAVYYISSKAGNGLMLSGSLMSGAQDMNDVYSASMMILVPDYILPGLKLLPGSTIVYAVSRNGTVAWAPLKFFLPSELYDNAFEAGGYYAFCQRPSSRDIQQYGILAYYRDKDKLSGIYGAPTEIHASDIIISTVNLPDNIARLVEQGKSSFIEYLNHFAKEDTKYLNRSYEITVTYMGEKKGHFNVRTYVKGEYEESPYGLIYRPSVEILNALGALKDYVVYSLASTNYEYANIVAGFTQSITQWNGDGELTVEANNRYEDGVRGYYFKQHCYFAKDDKQYLIRSIDANTILSGTYVFPSEIIGLNGEADTGIQLLKEFLEE